MPMHLPMMRLTLQPLAVHLPASTPAPLYVLAFFELSSRINLALSLLKYSDYSSSYEEYSLKAANTGVRLTFSQPGVFLLTHSTRT